MKPFFLGWSLLFSSSTLLVSPGSTLSQESVPAEAPHLTHSEVEEFLATAKMVDHRRLSTGVATLTDRHITHDAQIQTIDVTALKPKGE